jgi:hypothetical protein
LVLKESCGQVQNTICIFEPLSSIWEAFGDSQRFSAALPRPALCVINTLFEYHVLEQPRPVIVVIISHSLYATTIIYSSNRCRSPMVSHANQGQSVADSFGNLINNKYFFPNKGFDKIINRF